jgi:hypothetical protein
VGVPFPGQRQGGHPAKCRKGQFGQYHIESSPFKKNAEILFRLNAHDVAHETFISKERLDQRRAEDIVFQMNNLQFSGHNIF